MVMFEIEAPGGTKTAHKQHIRKFCVRTKKCQRNYYCWWYKL